MAFFDKLKSAIGMGESKPTAVAPEPTELEQLEKGNDVDAYISALRRRWLEKRLASSEDSDYLEQQFFPRISARFGGGAEGKVLVDLVRGAYGSPADEHYTPELLASARRLADGERGLEAWLCLSRGAFQKNQATRGLSLLVHALGARGKRHRLLGWELRLRLRAYAEHLNARIAADGETRLTDRDKGAAASLGCHLITAARDALDLVDRDELGQGTHAKEAKELSDWLSHLVEKAEEASVNSVPSPGQFIRIQTAAGMPAGDPFEQLRARVVQMRIKGIDDRFRAMERDSHTAHLKDLRGYYDKVHAAFGAFFPALEHRAESCVLSGDLKQAGELFMELYRRVPHRTYYAYRAGQTFASAGQRDEADRWFVHASRIESSSWRDRLARINAAMAGYEYEARALRELPVERRTEAAAALATALESRFTEAWEMLYCTAGPPLALRIAELCHLAGDSAADRSTAETCFEKAKEYYWKADQDEQSQSVGSRQAPEEVFDPIPLPAGTPPI